MGRFKSANSLDSRKLESQRIRAKYPDRIPVIIEKKDDETETRGGLPDIDRNKYLVPNDLTVGQFVYMIRKRIRLTPDKAIFLFVKNTLPPVSKTVLDVFEEYRDEDGFLYLTYSGERTFG